MLVDMVEVVLRLFADGLQDVRADEFEVGCICLDIRALVCECESDMGIGKYFDCVVY